MVSAFSRGDVIVCPAFPATERHPMKNESFWLLALIAVILVCAALEVQQSNSAPEPAQQGNTAR